MNKIAIISFAVGAISVFIGIYSVLEGKSGIPSLLNFTVLGIALYLIPQGIRDFIDRRKITEIENRLPDFLKDVAESSKFGTNLGEAIILAANGNYGILTAEIRKISSQIRWGVSVQEALEGFMERWPTPFIIKVMRTVIQTNKSGGNVTEVINIIADSTIETQLLNRDKRSQLNSYVVILIIAFGVYLLTIVILNVQFFPDMVRSGSGAGISNALTLINTQSIPTVKHIFTGTVIVYGVGNGLMTGVLKDGRLQSGFLAASVLMILGYLVLLFAGGV